MNLFQRLSMFALPLVMVACGTSSGSSGEEGGSGGTGGSGAAGASETGGGGSGGEGGQPVCPSLENAAVHYLSQDPAQCDLTDCGGAETDCIPCAGNQEYFSDEVCGCGCIDIVPATCPDPSDPAVHYLETDRALCGLTDCGGTETDCIPCEPAQEYFENECGCGCIDPST
jgi:hypothetical protein